MRTLSAPLLASIAEDITDPVWLAKIDFAGTIIRASSREEVTFQDELYFILGLEVRSLNRTSVTLVLPNEDRAISALAFQNAVQGNAVELFLTYGGEGIARFVGLLDKPSISRDYNEVKLDAVSEYAVFARWPIDQVTDENFNHLPAPGTVLNFATVNLVLERERT